MKTDAAEVRVIADTMAPEDDVKDKISVEAQLLIDVLGKSNKKIKDFDVEIMEKQVWSWQTDDMSHSRNC